MTTYYVSGTGNDSHNGLSEANAFRSLSTAVYKLQTGDTIELMNGTYDKGSTLYNFNGSPTKWTTIKAYTGHKPVIKTVGSGINLFSCSFVKIENIEFKGNRENVTLDYALAHKDNLNDPLTNSTGINIKPGRNSKGEGGGTPHHIVISGNKVRDFPGGGIESSDSDYITIENNIVSGNAWYTPYGGQGITTLYAVNTDDNTTDYKIIYRGNIVFDNQSLVPWKQTGTITEGHGLMLDTTNKSRDGKAYTGRTLIANNIVYKNGNAGINPFQADNVLIANNTVYSNSRKITGQGEIRVNYSSNVQVNNNIMFPGSKQPANLIRYCTGLVTFDNNLANSTIFQASSDANHSGLNNILGKDPLFTNQDQGDFRLKPESPAIVNGKKLGYEGNYKDNYKG